MIIRDEGMDEDTKQPRLPPEKGSGGKGGRDLTLYFLRQGNRSDATLSIQTRYISNSTHLISTLERTYLLIRLAEGNQVIHYFPRGP